MKEGVGWRDEVRWVGYMRSDLFWLVFFSQLKGRLPEGRKGRVHAQTKMLFISFASSSIDLVHI